MPLEPVERFIPNGFARGVFNVKVVGAYITAVALRIKLPRAEKHSLNIHVCPAFGSVKNGKVGIRSVIHYKQVSVLVPHLTVLKILPLLGRKLPAGTVHCRDIHKGMFPACIFCAILHRIVIDSISVLCYTNGVEVNRWVPSGQL